MSFIQEMDRVVEYRGGKKRVPGLVEPTFYVDQEAYNDAILGGYITEDGVVTEKFRAAYADMFDRIGVIKQ